MSRNKTYDHGYAIGYQNAIQEIIEIAEAEGSEAALKYALDNRQATK